MIDFDSPITAALFDRTPEQRKRHTELLIKLARRNPDRSVDELSGQIDEVMYGEFLSDVDAVVEERVRPQVSAAINQSPTVDYEALCTVERQNIQAELALLHSILPLPGFDQLVEGPRNV